VSNNVLLNGHGFIKTINAGTFNDIALQVYRHQFQHNDIYRSFAETVHKTPDRVQHIYEIPYLPVSFFKTHKVTSGIWEPELVFESSKTTGDTPARHFVKSAGLYNESLLAGFEAFYGSPADYTILALLPSYLERSNASLVHMVKVLMDYSGNTRAGFYLDEWAQLAHTLQQLERDGRKTLLIGVTFALLDFAEAHPMHLKNTIVMETGGMKGRKEEWTRRQVHTFLKDKWGVSEIHSEYGMTELLSQSYAKADGIFTTAPTMKVLVRDMNDPFDITAEGSGCLNIIDLANIHSCAFIATDDIGKISSDGSFEVLGRADHSALRGCSLMAI